MRKIILLPLFFPAVIVFLSSCKKESVSNTAAPTIPGETINVSVAPNQLYQMNIADAGTISINKQANHFLVSEAQANSETGSAVYKYIPATGFVGNDEVVLISIKTVTNYSESGGGGCNQGDHVATTTATTSSYSKSITLKITVSNY
jgi:hypothetical protein